jgi:hypothetical protein
MRQFIVSLIAVLAFVITPAFANDSAASARSAALKVVSALFVDHDITALKDHIAADAERKTDGAGSLIKVIEKAPMDAFAAMTLKQVKFFTVADIDAMSKEHPDGMWERLRAKLDGGLGVLAVLDVTGEEADEAKAVGKPAVGLISLVIKDVDGRPQVVYSDDN